MADVEPLASDQWNYRFIRGNKYKKDRSASDPLVWSGLLSASEKPPIRLDNNLYATDVKKPDGFERGEINLMRNYNGIILFSAIRVKFSLATIA